ncbi:FadR/GntR family transcriptional regulator [Sneathiella limimaris]|uniref:FadR/GntR family transcriptional regulator n=1 Tax=Sneathiella limimaris TaxID=1964213 RepID=UPI00146D657C|nr:GntR family transcriptional regulator [Sneathiella limimaris]
MFVFGHVDRTYPRSGIHGRVVHELGREIVTGVYQQGQRLPSEDEFLRRFNGSRTAIREAFRVLTAKGLLEAKQRSGTIVRSRQFWNLWDPDILMWHQPRSLSQGHVKQLMQLRLIVEPEAARMVAASEQETIGYNPVEKSFILMERAWEEGNLLRAWEAELAFHCYLLESCGNEFISRAKEPIKLSIRHCQEKRQEYSESIKGSGRWYCMIVDKIKAGDGEGASNGVRSLIQRDIELLFGRSKNGTQKKGPSLGLVSF